MSHLRILAANTQPGIDREKVALAFALPANATDDAINRRVVAVGWLMSLIGQQTEAARVQMLKQEAQEATEYSKELGVDLTKLADLTRVALTPPERRILKALGVDLSDIDTKAPAGSEVKTLSASTPDTESEVRRRLGISDFAWRKYAHA